MGRSVGFRGLSLLLLVMALLPCVFSIYCDEDDCYDLLGVTQTSTTSDIKKAYYKLSLKLHPDKNPDPEAKKQFIKVANAYEILSDEAKREQYDYAIAHPEEVFYNTARYYQTYYGPQADLRAVLVGLLIILSGFQYLNQWTHYSQDEGGLSDVFSNYCTYPATIWEGGRVPLPSVMVDMVKQTPAYKNKLKALELERNGSVSSKRKGFKPKTRGADIEELSKELELQIQGAEKPTVWRLLGIRFTLLPYTIGKLAIWQGRWIWRYWIKKLPYTWEDAGYLTKYYLPFPPEVWATLSEDGRDDLIRKRLWIRNNLDEFIAERKKESRESRRRRS